MGTIDDTPTIGDLFPAGDCTTFDEWESRCVALGILRGQQMLIRRAALGATLAVPGNREQMADLIATTWRWLYAEPDASLMDNLFGGNYDDRC